MGKRAAFRKTKKWEPNKWKPVYESIVSKHILGLSNKELADQYGYTEQTVSNILSSEQAKIIIGLATNKLRENAAELLSTMETRAMSNITRVLTSDKLLDKSPFQMLAASMDYLKSMGKIGKEDKKESGNVTNNVILGSPEQVERFLKATDKSDEVLSRLLPAGSPSIEVSNDGDK